VIGGALVGVALGTLVVAGGLRVVAGAVGAAMNLADRADRRWGPWAGMFVWMACIGAFIGGVVGGLAGAGVLDR